MQLIVFEGIDASGKETQAKLLANTLEELGFSVYSDSFPRYETEVGKVIKSHLTGAIPLTDEGFHMLLEVDRQLFMGNLEKLESYGTDFMILDRFTLSNLAFGSAKGLDIEWLKNLQSKVRKPDLTFLVDISPQTSYERRKEGRDIHENDSELLVQARKNYVELYVDLAISGQPIFRINGEQSLEEIQSYIKRIVVEHYHLKL